MQATVGIFGGWIWLKWSVSAALKIDKSCRWFQGSINGLIRYVELEIGGLNKQGVFGVWCSRTTALRSWSLFVFLPLLLLSSPSPSPKVPVEVSMS